MMNEPFKLAPAFLRESHSESLLPSSILVGLALPFAALGIVLIGMNLVVMGQVVWALSIILIAFSLNWFSASIVTAGVVVFGAALWRALHGDTANLDINDNLALALNTLLALCVGRLAAREFNLRSRIAQVNSRTSMYGDLVNSIFSASSECVKLLATDGSILAINDSGWRLLAAENAEQVIGRNWFAFWSGEQREQLGKVWHEVLTHGAAEFYGNCRIFSGERRDWRNSFRLVRTPDGNQTYVVCVSCDVTATVTTQHTLQVNVAHLKALLDNSEAASFAIDTNWLIKFANQSAEKLSAQWEKANPCGKSVWEVFPLHSDEPAAIFIRRAVEQKIEQRCEFYHRPEQRWFSLAAIPFAAGVNIVVSDITAAKNSRILIETQNTRLQAVRDIADFGEWSFEYDQGSMEFSQRALALLELEDCCAQEQKNKLFERLETQSRMELAQAIVNCSATAPSMDVTLQMATAAATLKYLRWHGRLVTDAHGNALRLLGTVQELKNYVAPSNVRHEGRVALDQMVLLPSVERGTQGQLLEAKLGGS